MGRNVRELTLGSSDTLLLSCLGVNLIYDCWYKGLMSWRKVFRRVLARSSRVVVLRSWSRSEARADRSHPLATRVRCTAFAGESPMSLPPWPRARPILAPGPFGV